MNAETEIPPGILDFRSPVEYDLWTRVYAAACGRPYWKKDEDKHGIAGREADQAVREMRKRWVDPFGNGKPHAQKP